MSCYADRARDRCAGPQICAIRFSFCRFPKESAIAFLSVIPEGNLLNFAPHDSIPPFAKDRKGWGTQDLSHCKGGFGGDGINGRGAHNAQHGDVVLLAEFLRDGCYLRGRDWFLQ